VIVKMTGGQAEAEEQMSPKLGGAFMLLIGAGMALFARFGARMDLAARDDWLQKRSERVRQRYEVSPTRRQARQDLLTAMFVVVGVLFGVIGLLVLIGVLGGKGR
jgi:uncharacterized iron-regulated membrane protein